MDAEGGDDIIRSVQSVKGKSSKLPSHEEFFSEESQPSASALPHSFNQLRLSRPLLRAINEMGFTTPTPIQVASLAPLYDAGSLYPACSSREGHLRGGENGKREDCRVFAPDSRAIAVWFGLFAEL